MPILIAVLVFGIVVLVHEFGHYIVARRCGILVEEFAIGMGPKLVGKQVGETLYSIRALPIGGFCKMYGDEADSMADRSQGEAEPEGERIPSHRSYNSKSILQRMAVMLAGSVANFILAFLLFSVVVGAMGFNTTTIHQLAPDMPAAEAGLQPGDSIVSLNGAPVFLHEDLLLELDIGGGRPIDLGIQRGDTRYVVPVTPVLTTPAGGGRGRYRIGFNPVVRAGMFGEAPAGRQNAHIGEVLGTGFHRIGFSIRSTVLGVVRMVTRQAGPDEMLGPIGIVNFIGDEYHATLAAAEELAVPRSLVVLSIVISMTGFAALLSASLGVVNLLPIPALDGGRLVFLLVEAVRRKPISPEREGMVHVVGFVLIMVLAVFIAYQDIVRLL